MTAPVGRSVHLEPVMGTVVGLTGRPPIPGPALEAAVGVLHEADRIFSTWQPDSPMSRLRDGRARLGDLDPTDAARMAAVLERCRLARELTGGAFDPWSLPGGVDPTGLVKGWAVARALDALVERGVTEAMVNAGGDIAVVGAPDGAGWRIGIRHPFQPGALAAAVNVTSAIATSGNYERPGQLIDPVTGRAVHAVASATVTGPELDLADALATGLAVAGRSLLPAIDGLPGYAAYLITSDGGHFRTPGLALSDQAAVGPVK